MKHRATLAFMGLTFAILLFVTFSAPALRAQSQTSPSTTAGPLAFDAASVKPSAPDATGLLISGPAPAGFMARNAPLDRLVMYAFGMRDDQLVSLPEWARSARFDIVAKYPEGQRPSGPQVALMVQALLTERFKLTTHKEMREGPTYALVLARRDGRLGPRLKANTTDCATYLAEKRTSGEAVVNNGIGDAPLCSPGVMSNRFIKMSARPIDNLAAALARQVGRPVTDQTGLAGNFDFNLEWSPDLSVAAPAADGAARIPQPDDVSLITALEEQLGLRLESSRGPIEVLVIDHLERPTPN